MFHLNTFTFLFSLGISIGLFSINSIKILNNGIQLSGAKPVMEGLKEDEESETQYRAVPKIKQESQDLRDNRKPKIENTKPIKLEQKELPRENIITVKTKIDAIENQRIDELEK